MSQKSETQGRVVIISGPSGVGKSTICKGVVKRLEGVHLSVSLTTRPKGESEVEGEDYRFVSEEEFQRLIDEGELLEHAEVFGNLYGTPRDEVEEALRAGKTVILEIDVQGAKQVKARMPDAVMVFILPPSAKILAERLNRRNRDEAEVAEERLNGAGAEIAAAWQHYEHMIINDDLEQAIEECVQVIESAKRES